MVKILQQQQNQILRVHFVGEVEKLENENCGRVKKWEDRKDFNFLHFCLVRSGNLEG